MTSSPTRPGPVPGPALNRLLISHITLRGPELKQLFGFIGAHRSVTYSDLANYFVPAWHADENFGLNEAPLREALNFLLVAGMVTQHGDSRRKAAFEMPSAFADQDFELTLLQAVNSHADERQRAISLVHRHLVARDILSINPSSLRAELERSPYAKLFIWTGEKVLFWSQLTSFVGLVLRLDRSLEVLVAPQPLFLLKVLRWCAPAQVGPFQLFDLLDTTDRTLFACFTERGRVHSGLAYSLTALDRLGHVRLTHSADAARSLLLDQWRVSNIEFVSREDPL